MKKFSILSLALICFLIMGMSLTSCGDDEPIISNNVQKTELTTPLFLWENPGTDLIGTIVNGFTFWSFNESKAAECSIILVGTKPHLLCDRYEESWNLADGKLLLGGSSFTITKVNLEFLKVRAYKFGGKTYFDSNMTVAGVKAEDIFTKGITKEQLWQVIEKSNVSGKPEPLKE